MYTKKFLQQVYGELVRNEIENVKLRETCIEIFKDENVVFKISGKGEMFYSADKQFRDFVDNLHGKIQPIVCDVDEYLQAMENGEELKAVNFNMPYKKLAEFNEVVFAATQHSNGSYEFVTYQDCI